MGARTHIGAKHKMFRLKVILVLFCTYITFSQNRKPKIVFSKRDKGATPSFFEPHRGTRAYLMPCDESPVYSLPFLYSGLII